MVPRISREEQPKCLFPWWNFCYTVWFRIVFAFSWSILFWLFFFHHCRFPLFIISMVYFSMVDFYSYIVIVYRQCLYKVSNSFSIFGKQFDVVQMHKEVNFFLRLIKLVSTNAFYNYYWLIESFSSILLDGFSHEFEWQ